MMPNITNYIQFESDDIDKVGGKGRISTLDRDIEITVTPFQSDKDKAPTHSVYAKSPAGYDINVGAIWQGENAQGGMYRYLTLKRLDFRANLGRFAGQDDGSLQAIIEWDRNL